MGRGMGCDLFPQLKGYALGVASLLGVTEMNTKVVLHVLSRRRGRDGSKKLRHTAARVVSVIRAASAVMAEWEGPAATAADRKKEWEALLPFLFSF